MPLEGAITTHVAYIPTTDLARLAGLVEAIAGELDGIDGTQADGEYRALDAAIANLRLRYRLLQDRRAHRRACGSGERT